MKFIFIGTVNMRVFFCIVHFKIAREGVGWGGGLNLSEITPQLDFQVENQPRAAYIGRQHLSQSANASQEMSQLKFFYKQGWVGNSDRLSELP